MKLELRSLKQETHISNRPMPRKGLVQHSCLYVTPYITLVCSEVEAAVPSSPPSSLRSARHLLSSRLQIVQSLRVEGSDRLGEVPVHLGSVQVQPGGGVVRDHPGKHGVLRQVVERSVSWKYSLNYGSLLYSTVKCCLPRSSEYFLTFLDC